MDKQVPQALSDLLPTWTGPLPPELIALAGSLLAQSRSKASNLKADEEIARSYACSNIACERLKQSLGLPKIEPNPPCPPRTYQRLYQYLDGALPLSIRKGRSAPGRKRSEGLQPNSSPAKHVRPDRAPQHRSSRLTTNTKSGFDAAIPSWLMPAIRHLCRCLEAPAAPHHVFAGVSSILSSVSQSKTAPKISIPGLVISVFILVTTRLAGVETTKELYLRQKHLGLVAVREALSERNEEVECTEMDVDECLRQIGEHSWTEMDWFENVEPGSGLVNGEDDSSLAKGDSHEQEDEQEEGHSILPFKATYGDDLEETNSDYLQPGLGTMMNESIDWLSDAKRRSYDRWKADILRQIEELKAQEPDMMNTEDG